MKRVLAVPTATALAAFANAAPAKSNPPAAPKAEKAATVVPVLTAARADVPMPTRVNRRGTRSVYDFDSLVSAGMSFGVKNKTAASLGTVIANHNKKHRVEKRDENGSIVFKTTSMKAADGSTTVVPTTEPETIQTKHFFAVDVDPKNDPDGATCRVFRDL